MKQIIIDIVDGAATIETKGFAGKACLDATKDLEAAMGVKTSDVKTPEYREHQQRVATTGA